MTIRGERTHGEDLAAVGSAKEPADRRRTLRAVSQLGLPLVVLAMCIYFTVRQPLFATPSNGLNVARQFSFLAVFAFAQSFPILVGGFDISIGSQVGLSSVVMALVTQKAGLPAGLAAGIATAGIVGAINGFTIARFVVSPFVVTLGMLSAALGLALFLTNGRPVYGFNDTFTVIATGYIGPVSVPLLIAACVFVVSWFVLTRTVYGRHLYAVGGNEEAARLSGVNVFRTKMLAYIICGLITGIGAMVLTARVASGQPNLGTGLELESIAAVVIGGVALGGGEGRLARVVWGVLVMSLLSNGLDLLQVSSYIQLMVIGVVFVVAVIFDGLKKRAG
ncbi:MAG TPA: ABC transporter permease [Actinomycetes bacterium]|nr:ABC transporter permease [Actinomycetes bacterium]